MRLPCPSRALLIISGALVAAGVGLWWAMDERRGVAWAIAWVRRRFPDVAPVTVEALAAWRADAAAEQAQVLDARARAEFAVSHLPGARLMRRGDVAAGLDPERPVVVYCSAGYRSAKAARRLRAAGFERVLNLEGGIFAWANAGHALEREGRPARGVHPCLRLFSRMVREPRLR